MIKKTKWYIFDCNNNILYWETQEGDKIIEFESLEQAQDFLIFINKTYPHIVEEARIEEKNIRYNNGFINGVEVIKELERSSN